MDVVLQRFKQKLEKQKKALMAKDKNSFANGNPRPVKYAGGYQYIGINQKIASYIVIDVDRPISMLELKKQCLPIPTIAVYGVTGKPHLFYELKDPVLLGQQARRAPIKLLELLDMELTLQLDGDTAFTGLYCKNPLCKTNKVQTHDVTYSMNELAELMSFKTQSSGKMKSIKSYQRNAQGRNHLIFESTRHRAYRLVRQYDCATSFASAVKGVAHSYNEVGNYEHLANSTLLDGREVTRVANSIIKWVWKRRDKFAGGDYRDRGVMGYSSRHDDHTQPYLSDDEVMLRQQAGALYTAKLKADVTQSKVSRAVHELSKQGIKVTAIAVAKLTGMHRNTVRRYL